MTMWNNEKFPIHCKKSSSKRYKNGNDFIVYAQITHAGSTKLALVTNVSENSKGVIEAEVAYNGEVTTLASAEKQDFDGIVKVFDGSNDKDVSRADATINAAGNSVFHGQKLSEVVNNGGQYAEVTTDADGKLTKLVFMDDDNANDNLLKGHYYEVSRNLVLNVADKNLKYGINDSNRAQYFAADDALYTTGRLEAASAGYADEAKFYTIDANPSRHDKNYAGTRLTVLEGFDRLSQNDIKAGEKADIDFNEPHYNATKNIYEVSDLAFNNSGDLVAVYSFKSMDEKSSKNVVMFTNGNRKDTYDVNDTLQMSVKMMDGATVPANLGYAVFDEKGSDVSSLFTISGGNITVKTETPSGTYYVRLLDRDGKAMTGSYKFVVVNQTKTTPVNITGVEFVDGSGNGDKQNAYISKDGKSFDIKVTTGTPVTRAAVEAKLTANNVDVYDDGVRLTVKSVTEKSANIYTITVEQVIDAGSKLKVSVVAGGDVQINGQTAGNVMDEAPNTEVLPDAPVVIADGVKYMTADGSAETDAQSAVSANEIYFKLTKDGKVLGKLEGKVSLIDKAGFPLTGYKLDATAQGLYKITSDPAGTPVAEGSYDVAVDTTKVATVVVEAAAGKTELKTFNVSASAAKKTEVRIALEAGVAAKLATELKGQEGTVVVKSGNQADLSATGTERTCTKVEAQSDDLVLTVADFGTDTHVAVKIPETTTYAAKDALKTGVAVTPAGKKELTTFNVSASAAKKTEVRIALEAGVAAKLATELKGQEGTVVVKSGNQADLSATGTERTCTKVEAQSDDLVLTVADFGTDTHVAVKIPETTTYAAKDALKTGVAVTPSKTALNTFNVKANLVNTTEVRVTLDSGVAAKIATELKSSAGSIIVKSGKAADLSSGTARVCSAVKNDSDDLVLTVADFKGDTHVAVQLPETTSYQGKDNLKTGVALAKYNLSGVTDVVATSTDKKIKIDVKDANVATKLAEALQAKKSDGAFKVEKADAKEMNSPTKLEFADSDAFTTEDTKLVITVKTDFASKFVKVTFPTLDAFEGFTMAEGVQAK